MVHGFMVYRRPTLVMAGVVRLFMEQSWQPHMCRERKRDFASETIDLSYGSRFDGPLMLEMQTSARAVLRGGAWI
jgi:hypothetical protein